MNEYTSLEKASRERLADHQLDAFRSLLDPVLRLNRFYQRKLGDAGVPYLSDTATNAEKATAAAELGEVYSQLRGLIETGLDSSPVSPNRVTLFDLDERLGEYIHFRVQELETVLDSSTATATEKAAALTELQGLRDQLVNMGRTRAPAGAAVSSGDGDLDTIDRRLGEAASTRVQELAKILQDQTATATAKQAALDELEGLRDRLRGLYGENFEILNQIEKLLEQGLIERLEQLENGLDGGAVPAGPITSTTTSTSSPGAINLLENPGMLASSVADLENFGQAGGPSLVALVSSTGVSTGPESFDITIANAGSAARLNGDGLVLEPLTEEMVAAVKELWPQIVAQANAVVSVFPEGYCLEKEQRPPTMGELYTLAAAGKQGEYAPVRSILRTSTGLHNAGQLYPEAAGDPEQYFHSIRQWSIWTHDNGFDEAAFAEAFVEHTMENVMAAGLEWTDEVEAQIRSWAPNRWQDITSILNGAGLATP